MEEAAEPVQSAGADEVVPMSGCQTNEEAERARRLAEKRSSKPGRTRFLITLNIGIILTAIAIVLFKAPNGFAFGGTSGLSIVLSKIFPTMPVSAFMWVINAILVALGLVFLPRRAVGWSVAASFLLSLYVSLFEWIFPSGITITGDMWLDLCFAVILPSLGSAIVFDIGASTGGTDILAMILNRRYRGRGRDPVRSACRPLLHTRPVCEDACGRWRDREPASAEGLHRDLQGPSCGRALHREDAESKCHDHPRVRGVFRPACDADHERPVTSRGKTAAALRARDRPGCVHDDREQLGDHRARVSGSELGAAVFADVRLILLMPSGAWRIEKGHALVLRRIRREQKQRDICEFMLSRTPSRSGLRRHAPENAV